MQFELVDGHVALTGEQRELLPLVVLINPERNRGAAYNGRRALIVADASPELLRFAITRHTHMELWEPGLTHGPQERPAWMSRADLDGWLMFWVRDEFSTQSHLSDLPLE